MNYAEVIGHPISHSKSPLIHRFWLEQLGVVADYRARDVLPADLGVYFDEQGRDPAWRGCNITIPHKIAALDFVSDPGDVRGSIGAMNTVFRNESGALVGTNTDAAGFYGPIADVPLAGESAIVIGAGGAARAVLFALAQADVGEVVIIARNALKAAGLLAHFGLKGRVLPLAARLPEAVLLVNASPLGMKGKNRSTSTCRRCPNMRWFTTWSMRRLKRRCSKPRGRANSRPLTGWKCLSVRRRSRSSCSSARRRPSMAKTNCARDCWRE